MLCCKARRPAQWRQAGPPGCGADSRRRPTMLLTLSTDVGFMLQRESQKEEKTCIRSVYVLARAGRSEADAGWAAQFFITAKRIPAEPLSFVSIFGPVLSFSILVSLYRPPRPSVPLPFPLCSQRIAAASRCPPFVTPTVPLCPVCRLLSCYNAQAGFSFIILPFLFYSSFQNSILTSNPRVEKLSQNELLFPALDTSLSDLTGIAKDKWSRNRIHIYVCMGYRGSRVWDIEDPLLQIHCRRPPALISWFVFFCRLLQTSDSGNSCFWI